MYVGKAETKFGMSLNNYKSADKSFKTKKQETQELFHRHYTQDNEEKDNLQFTLIDQCTNNAEFQKREVYWQHHLKRFFPNGLNEHKECCL